MDVQKVGALTMLIGGADEGDKIRAIAELTALVDDAFGLEAAALALAVREKGGIQSLVRLLDDELVDVQQCSMSLLSNLLTDMFDTDARLSLASFAACGGFEKLLVQLQAWPLGAEDGGGAGDGGVSQRHGAVLGRRESRPAPRSRQGFATSRRGRAAGTGGWAGGHGGARSRNRGRRPSPGRGETIREAVAESRGARRLAEEGAVTARVGDGAGAVDRTWLRSRGVGEGAGSARADAWRGAAELAGG